MDQIKAFVGHSFLPDDQDVVGRFLKYFEQLENLLPQFSWDNAEAAEPVELAEKVRKKFAESNVFIGICTRRELAVSQAKLTGVFFMPEYRKANLRDLEAKASDWVTQELGFAMGRGLPLIILQEEGIRKPGGLQGDREYIPFKRESPEQSFGQILEMLSALSPPSSKDGTTSDAPKADPTAVTAAEGNQWDAPEANWTEENYRMALLHLTAGGELEKADAIYAAYALSDIGKEGAHTAELAAHQEYLKIVFGKGGSLDRITSLANANPSSAKILSTMARSQTQFDNHGAAATAYEAAANIDRDSKDGLYYLGRAAIEYAKSNQMVRAQALIEEIKTKTNSDKTLERELARVLHELVEVRKDEEAPVITLERTVDLSPDDYDSRFSLAYKHSQLGNEELALYHYLKIPPESRTAIVWNNLGVSYDHFKMRAASVWAYRKAEEMGETLAMSNLGYKFIKGGFEREAKAEFDKGFAITGHHRNIEEGLSALTKIADEEDAKQEQALGKATPKVDFYRNLAAAIAAPQLAELPAKMNAPEGQIKVTVNGDAFSAIGTYEREGSGLAIALYGGQQEKREYKIEYQGRITGTQIEATVSRIQTSGPQYNSLLSLSDNKSKVLIFVDPTGELRAMENPHSENPNFYGLTPA